MPDGARLFSHFVEWLSGALIRASLLGTAAILCAWIVCRLLTRSSPIVHCWAWRLAYIKLIAALILASPVMLPILPAAPVTRLPIQAMDERSDAEITRPRAASGARQPPEQIPLTSIVVALWLIGVSWNLARVWRERREATILRAACRPATDLVLMEECARISSAVALRRTPDVLLSRAGVPMVHGIAAPALLLPEPLMDSLTETQRRMVLAHEIAHVRRRDLLWIWLPTIARCLFYFLPSVWLAEREWQQSQELACDQLALLQSAGSRSEYGALLLRLAQLQSGPAPALAAIRAAGSFQSVRRRLLAMKHLTNRPRPSLAAAVALGAAAIAGIAPWKVCAQDSADLAKRNAEAVAISGSPYSKKLAAALNLTETQQLELQAIRDETQRRVGQVLTPEQRRQLQEVGDPKRAAMNEVFAKIGITQQQERAIEALEAEDDRRLGALKQDQNLSVERREANMKEIQRAHQAGIMKLLTADQVTRLKSVQSVEVAEGNSLELTAEQQSMVQRIKKDAAEQLRKLDADTSLPKDQLKVQEELIERATQEAFRQLFIPEQRAKYEVRGKMERSERADGTFGWTAIRSLNGLTQDQQDRLKQLYEAEDKRVQQVMTAEQRSRFKELRFSGSAK